MKTVFLISGILLLALLFNSCYTDKEELLYGLNRPCTDTTGTISYSQKIVPLLQQGCYSCHTGNFPSGNILMGSYAADKVIAQNGKLYGAISHSTGYAAMPQGQPKLNNCSIATIKKWIDSGMLNN